MKKKSYIIFLCTDDLFDRNLPKYTFRNVCLEDKSLEMGDEATKVVINARGNRDGISKELSELLDLMQGKAVDEGLPKKIKEAVDEAVEHRKWRPEYMYYIDRLREAAEEAAEEAAKEARERGLQEGRERGLQEGLQRGQSQMLVSLYIDGTLGLDMAASKAKMTEEEFLKLVDSMKDNVTN